MLKSYIIAAAIFMLGVVATYVVRFVGILGYPVSNDSAVWGQFGDYVGGLLNPVLSFMSLIMLIKSLTLQNEANQALRDEIKGAEKTEKLRSFGALFFNMIDSQKALLDNFYIEFAVEEGEAPATKRGVGAIMSIEDGVERMRQAHATDDDIRQYLEALDYADQIFGILRGFYVTVKIISEKLGEINGFCSEDRAEYFSTLINFTDFSQLRLIGLGMQFLNYQPAKYLRENSEFCSVLTGLGLRLDAY